MIQEHGNWTDYRSRFPGIVEVDFHWSEFGEREVPYWEAMDEVYEVALAALKDAHEQGAPYVMFRHGCSTSLGWKQRTSRSVVRGLMRSKVATPFILRSQCIQHDTVFVAVIRPTK